MYCFFFASFAICYIIEFFRKSRRKISEKLDNRICLDKQKKSTLKREDTKFVT